MVGLGAQRKLRLQQPGGEENMAARGGALSGGAGPQWRGPAVAGTRCRRTGGFVVQLPKISFMLSSCSAAPSCAALLSKRFCLTRFITRARPPGSIVLMGFKDGLTFTGSH